MKLTIFPFALLLFFHSLVFPQNGLNDNEMKWVKNWTNFDPNHESYPSAEEQLPTIIDEDIYLKNDLTYLLSGNVYVTNGAILTIQEGTIIRCDTDVFSSLVITKNAKLVARGLKGQPIVFTSNKSAKSRQSGDWGGIIIAGSGKINSPSGTNIIEGDYLPQYSIYGGNESTEMTAIMTYVRIEYAGQKINSTTELNGLSLYALGSDSIINNVMISYSADDSFECFGGSANMNNLVSYKAKDDDFDFTLGYKGELYNVIAVRHPYISDASGSYAIEIDGYDKKSGIISKESLSYVRLSNATLINLSNKSNFKHTTAAISSKSLARLSFTESKISGFANVVKFDKSYRTENIIEESFTLENSIFNVHDKNILVQFEPSSGIEKILKYNMFTTQFKSAEDIFTNPLDTKNPIFTIKESNESYTVKQ